MLRAGYAQPIFALLLYLSSEFKTTLISMWAGKASFLPIVVTGPYVGSWPKAHALNEPLTELS